jgi:hypothetical protein
MKKLKSKNICRGSKKDKEWIGHKVLDLKTGESEWKMKTNQGTKDYRKPLKGEHLLTPKRKWKKGFERLAYNLAQKNKQLRNDERKEKNKKKL